MKLGIALAGGALAVGAVAAGAVALGVIDIPPLTGDGDDAVELEPLVDDEETTEDGVPLEPLVPNASVPPGTDLAAAYRIEVRHNYTASHNVGIAADTQVGDEYYVGDVVRVGDSDRYEGWLLAVATLDQTATGMDGSTCHIYWAGRQVGDAVLNVWQGEDLPEYMLPDADPDGVYAAIYLTEPAGPVDWTDPDNDCNGATSDILPVSWTGPELQSSALGAATPRLPPPGFGKIEERIEYSGPGMFGETTYTWVFTITPLDADEVQEPDDLDVEVIAIPPLVEE